MSLAVRLSGVSLVGNQSKHFFRPVSYRKMALSTLSPDENKSPALTPKFSQGESEDRMSEELNALVSNGWQLDDEQIGVMKTYHFKTYTKVLDIHHCIGVRSKASNHHPQMTTKTGSLTVFWTTHNPRGLSFKDVSMAKYCDEQAKLIGTVIQSDANKCGPSSS